METKTRPSICWNFHKSKTVVIQLLADSAMSALEMANAIDMEPSQLDGILRALTFSGRIAQAADSLLFEIVARTDESAASEMGDLCDHCSRGVIGMDGHCHWCGRAVNGFCDSKGACGCGGTRCTDGTCGEQLATTGNLTEADWREIYSSLDSTWRNLADDDCDEIVEQYRQHLRTIMAKIGPDGQDMVQAKGVTGAATKRA